jgi:hypothetical protein
MRIQGLPNQTGGQLKRGTFARAVDGLQRPAKNPAGEGRTYGKIDDVRWRAHCVRRALGSRLADPAGDSRLAPYLILCRVGSQRASG